MTLMIFSMMKKIKITLLALCAVALTGCVGESQRDKVDTKQQSLYLGGKIMTADYNGHRYIIYKGYRKGGITHDPDCPCRKKGDSEHGED